MRKILAAILCFSVVVLMLAGCGFGSGREFELSDKELSLTVGDSRVISVIPGSANKKLTWSTSNSSIATVENGTVKAKAVGSAVITAVSESGTRSTCDIIVKEKEVQSITLNIQTTTLEVGRSVQLQASVYPPDASASSVSWSSQNGGVAVVNSLGNVTAVKEGVTNIVCKAGNVEASCTVMVNSSTKTQSSRSDEGQSSKSYEEQSSQQGGTPYGHYNPGYTYNSNDFVFPDSSVTKLTDSEIRAVLSSMTGYPVSSSFAQDAINEIYARNGYVFKNAAIKAYYNSKPWYYPDSRFTINDFNSIESYNIKLLKKYC